jgi:hypothetical protein
MRQNVGKIADNTGAIVSSSESHADDPPDKLVADFLALGGRIRTCKPEPHNKWQQQHRRVRGTRSMRGRSK